MTEFRAIEGYSGYRVSEVGEVESSQRGGWVRLSGHRRRDGNVGFMLKSDEGSYRFRRLQDLVLGAWVGARPGGKEAIFVDGDRGNCRASNLEWGRTKRERRSREGVSGGGT